jgi:hypothetical protein
MGGFCLLAVTLYLELLGRSWDYFETAVFEIKIMVGGKYK